MPIVVVVVTAVGECIGGRRRGPAAGEAPVDAVRRPNGEENRLLRAVVSRDGFSADGEDRPIGETVE